MLGAGGGSGEDCPQRGSGAKGHVGSPKKALRAGPGGWWTELELLVAALVSLSQVPATCPRLGARPIPASTYPRVW